MKKTLKKDDPLGACKTLVIAAGGTGGHISPGISIAEAWLAQGGRIILATLMKNIDYPDIVRLARNEAVTIVAYDAPRLTKNPLKLFSFFKRFLSAFRLIHQATLAEGADAVVGMGGYSSFPAVAYAIFKRKPLFLCEQNAHWGIVTRVGKFFAKGVFLSFPERKPLPAKFLVTGNPLRAMFNEKSRKTVLKKPSSKENILFIGGSQGATDINALYLAFAVHNSAAKYRCTVATGASAFADINSRARKNDAVTAFIEDMPAAYAEADFIVARCGSGVLFEILWANKPSFLIPYPFAAADHQKANALAIQAQIPSVIFDERPFSDAPALSAFLEFLKNPPAYRANPAEARPETKITRYITENLNHA